MKRYYNSTTKEWYTEGQSMTRKVENGVFSGIPSVELLHAWGFKEWIEPAPTPAQLLERAKQGKIAEIDAYDSSDEVNGFTYNGVDMWLDKATRSGLLMRFTAEQAMGKATTTLWYDSYHFDLPIEHAFQLLYALENYASACYDRTAAHKAAVEALESIEEVEAYDFRSGYPERLVF